jgi:hypothetical protein
VRYLIPLVVIFLGVTAYWARGDAFVRTQAMKASTIAEIFVEEDAIRVDLEIGVTDLPAFRNLLPDELLGKMNLESEGTAAERVARFFDEDWVIEDGAGERLRGTVRMMEGRQRIRRDEITGEPLPVPEGEEEAVVAVEILYPLKGRPEVLMFSPPQRAGGGGVSASVGFVAYHEGVPVNDFRYLSGRAILYLDWQDPWYSKFRNPNLQRTYSAPIQGFLYVENFEVRKEIVARPLDLQSWIDLGLEGKEIIKASEQAAIKEKVAAFLGKHCPVMIDGERVTMVLDRIHFIRRTLKGTVVIDLPEDLPVASATIGAIFVAPIKGLPQTVTMDWDLFNERIQVIEAVATDEAGGMPSRLMPDMATLEWKNYLKNPTVPSFAEIAPPPTANRISIPVVSLWCLLLFLIILRGVYVQRMGVSKLAKVTGIFAFIGIFSLWNFGRITVPNPFHRQAMLSGEEKEEVIGGLLRNTYRAFDFREESVIYDTLERSVEGDLLTEVYLDIQKALELQGQGGARARVTAVELLGVEAVPFEGGPAFEANCTWTVSGSVGHWGHIHQRQNQYEALLRVEPSEEAWKITGLELLDEKRL